MEFALPIDPHPYDPKRAKQLMVEAGSPNGFDAGDLTPNPPYFSMAEAVAVTWARSGSARESEPWSARRSSRPGAKRSCAASYSAWLGAGGNAATRVEALATKEGRYAYGVLPEVEDLFQRQAKEIDRKKREELLQQIQRILHDRVDLRADLGEWIHSRRGPQVEEPALTLIPAFPYSAPYEDVRLKRP